MTMTPWFEKAKMSNGGEVTDAMIHHHIGELEKMIDTLELVYKRFGEPDETQKLTVMIYKQCLEVHKAQLKKGGKSASFERLAEKAHDKEVEERLKQDPKTYTDEEVRQRRILGQTGNLFIDDDPEEGGWK